MRRLFDEITNFSKDKFPNASAQDHLKKLRQEAKEAIESPNDLYEYADCLIALIAAASRAGYSYDKLEWAAFEKLEVNKNRKWIKKSDGTFQHE